MDTLPFAIPDVADCLYKEPEEDSAAIEPHHHKQAVNAI